MRNDVVINWCGMSSCERYGVAMTNARRIMEYARYPVFIDLLLRKNNHIIKGRGLKGIKYQFQCMPKRLADIDM